MTLLKLSWSSTPCSFPWGNILWYYILRIEPFLAFHPFVSWHVFVYTQMLLLSSAGCDLLSFACATARLTVRMPLCFQFATNFNTVECCVIPHGIFARYTMCTCAFTMAMYRLVRSRRVKPQCNKLYSTVQQHPAQHPNVMLGKHWSQQFTELCWQVQFRELIIGYIPLRKCNAKPLMGHMYFKMMTHCAPEAEAARAQKGQSACAQAYTELWAGNDWNNSVTVTVQDDQRPEGTVDRCYKIHIWKQ